MANPHAGEVSFEIDGKEYSIKAKSRLLAEAETILGIESLIGRKLGYKASAVLLFVLCKDQGMTLDKAYDLSDRYLIVIQKALYQAIDFFYQNQVGLIEDEATTES